VIFTIFNILLYVSIIMGVTAFHFPYLSLLGLLTLVLAIPACQRALRYPDDIPNLMPALGQNVLINILTPVLLAIGLFIGI
ncbi:MAG: prenyltransferase, partial [Anaerolineaceae bacterium]